MCLGEQVYRRDGWRNVFPKAQKIGYIIEILLDRNMSSRLSWWTWFRYLQKTVYIAFSFILLTILSIFTLILFHNYTKFAELKIKPTPNPDLINQLNWNRQPPSDVLLDLVDFRILRKPVFKNRKDQKIFFLVVIHSKPDNFRQRQLIRTTWGSIKNVADGLSVKTTFILGIPDNSLNQKPLHLDVMRLIREESQRYGDLVIGNFIDHYTNLTYKHALSLKWASTITPSPSFILKTDDDAFVDIPGLYRFLQRTYDLFPYKPYDIIACNTIPSGTTPQREGKWAISEEEYPWSQYPQYCAGLAYIMSSDVANNLYVLAESNVSPKIWIDDVFFTGIIGAHLQLQPLNLNTRYCYDIETIEKWLLNAHEDSPPPYFFIHLDVTNNRWPHNLQELWSHTVNFYNLTFMDYR